MRKVTTYTGKDGIETFKVRYKIDGRSGSTTFPTADEADEFNLMVEKWGPRRALEFIKQPTDPKRIASGPTVTECVQTYISLRPSEETRDSYTRELNGRIAPALGDIRIGQLKSDDVQRWVNSQPGTTATIRRSHVILSGALKEAMIRGEIRTNPARGVKIPRRARNEARAPLTPPYTREEWRLICKHLTDPYDLLCEFLGETGCRIGEAAALTPADINLEAGKVHFCKTWSQSKIRGVGYSLRLTKTEESDRVIRVNQDLLERLDLSGPYVFTEAGEHGERVRDKKFNAQWIAALRESGLPAHRHGHPHDLRHAHASWLLDAGVSLPAIQKRLGHRDVTTTLNMYSHPATDSEAQILKALED